MAEPVEVLLPAAEIAVRVEDAARRLRPLVDDATVAVCLLTGGLWFAADLTRALARHGLNLAFDALWLSSYGDSKTTAGWVEVRAALQRPVAGRKVLLVDDVIDSGLSLLQAAQLVREAGAAHVVSCVFARKPWPTPREFVPDIVAWEAPARFLAGYGMDVAGRWRGSPDVLAFD
jgi:hypoxanthine phosphoribosyltransferase